MSMRIKMVVFDMAGTTVNEQNIVYKTLQRAINEAGFDLTLDQVLAEGAGKEKLQAIKSVLKVYAHNTDQAVAEAIYDNFSKQLTTAYEQAQLLPQPNAVELFRALRENNIKTILNTGYSRLVAQSIIDTLGWKEGHEYDALITASDVSEGRPSPAMIMLAAKQFDVQPSQTIKVGDSIIDIEEGKNAGCALSIGITTGAHTAEQLQSAHPDYVIHNLMELLPIIEGQKA